MDLDKSQYYSQIQSKLKNSKEINSNVLTNIEIISRKFKFIISYV